MKGKLWTALAVMVILSLGLAACGPTPAPPLATEVPPTKAPVAEFVCDDPIGCVDIASDEPIHIAYMLPTTGGASVYGESAIGAMKIAIEERGQIHGHDIQLTGEDSQCSAEGGEAAAQKIAADPTIVGVIGTTCSSAMTAAMLTVSEAGLTIISPSNTSPKLTDPNETWQPGYFRTAHNDLFQGAVAARFAYDELGARKAAAIHDGDPYTEGLAKAFYDAFIELGGTGTAFEAVNKGDTDMRPVLTTVAADPPDVLYFPIFQPEGDFIVAQSVEVAGLEDTVLFGADGLTVAPFAPSAGEAALGMYLSGPFLTGDKAAKFMADYEAMHGTKPPGPFGEHALDGINILMDAIEELAVVDDDGTLHVGRQALRDAVEATSGFEGITGTLDCGPKELQPGVEFRGDCATGEALAIFQVDAEWIASEDVYEMGVHPPVVWTPVTGAVEVPAAVAVGKTFIFGRGGDSIQLYPAVVTDGESFRVTGNILEPLFQYEDGGTKPVPALATDYSVSDDGLEWTVNLREGVKFHDGTDFNADAVVFNFERQWKTDHPLHFESETYAYWEYMWGGFDDDSIITGVEAVDDLTVKFTLSEPLAPMLANLAMDMFAISSPAAMEKYGEEYGTPSAGAVGTGPFKFVEWLEDDHITVEANTDYWAGAPTIGRIIWRVIPDDSARFLALKAGDIHAMEQAGIEDIRAAEEDPDLYVEATGLNTGYLAFNYHIEELRDPLVREAIFHAIDREALREAFYGDYGQVPTTFLHHSMWGRPDLEPWEYDPDLAKELLAEAGFPDGLKEVTNMDTGEVGPLKLYYMPVTRFYYPSPKEIGEAMAADLAKVGIETELILEGDWPAYLAAAREGRLYGLYMLGWGGDNGDPDNFLCYFFCRVTDEESAIGQGWYVNVELAELLKEAAVATDLAARDEMYKKAEQMLYDDRARLWVMHNDTPRLFSSKVSGFILQPVGADKYEWVVIAD